jgi:hypothetical protein
MPDISELVAAIDGRLAEIAAETNTLRAARAELAAPRPASQAPSAPRALRRRVSERVQARRGGGGAVQAETLERLLADTPGGLSANAIAKQAETGYSRTLKLLHELEAAGQVRRSGSRRSTVWELITDEDRIAQRAAELERLRGAPGQRGGKARTS